MALSEAIPEVKKNVGLGLIIKMLITAGIRRSGVRR